MLGLFASGLATLTLLYAPQPLLPALAGEYGQHPASATLAISVTTAGILLGVVPVAVLSQQYERRTVIFASLLLATFLGGFTALAPNWPSLLALRGLQGVALAGVPATATAYAAEVTGVGRAGLMAGLFVAGSTMGGLGGRLFAGIGADLGGWRAGLGVVSVLALAATLITRLALPRVPRPDADRDHPRAGQLATRTRTTSARALSAFWRESDSLQLRLGIIAALLMTAFSGTYNVLPFRLTSDPYLLSQGALGTVFFVYLAGTVASTVTGRLADRMPRKYLLLTAAILLATGGAITLTAPLPLVVAGLALLTGGFFAAHGVASGWTSVAARGQRSTAAARYTVWYYTGTTLGGPVGGLAYGHGGWTATGTVVAALGLTAAGVAVTLPVTLRPAPTAAPAPARSWRDRLPVRRPIPPLKPLRDQLPAVPGRRPGPAGAGTGTAPRKLPGMPGSRPAVRILPTGTPFRRSPDVRRLVTQLRGVFAVPTLRGPGLPLVRPVVRVGITHNRRERPGPTGDPRQRTPRESARAGRDRP
jgi:MFS transporter, YNFM family, putative membrane transport protein